MNLHPTRFESRDQRAGNCESKSPASRQGSQALADALPARSLTRMQAILDKTLWERAFWAICGVAELRKGMTMACARRLAALPKKHSLASM